MEISLLLMQQIAELFLMIFMGYVIVKAGLLRGEDSKVISKIVLYLIIPCVIINAFQVDYTSEKVQGLLLAFAASVMLQVVLLVIVWTAGRLMGLNEVEKASVYYSNAGNHAYCDLCTGPGMGAVWLRVYECTAGICVESWKKCIKYGKGH